jgi:hypothetical protein
MGQNDLRANVPQHTPNGFMKDPNPNPVDGPTEIVIVTYGTPKMRCSGAVVSDLDWLRWALRSIRRYCKGFQGVTVVHPRHESAMFEPLIAEFDVRLHAFDEVPGKGFLGHMVQMSSADTYVPPGTKYVLHADADCIFKMPTTPEDYFWEDKPYYITRTWASLLGDPRDPTGKPVSDCIMWQGPTNAQLGFDTAVYAMCMNTAVFPIDFYSNYRTYIEKTHHKAFEEYMLEGVNDHPGTNRMDWTAFGAFAWHKMHDRFTWFDAESGVYPADRKLAFWSHQGVTPDNVRQMEELLRYVPTPEEEARMAQ